MSAFRKSLLSIRRSEEEVREAAQKELNAHYARRKELLQELTQVDRAIASCKQWRDKSLGNSQDGQCPLFFPKK